MALVRATEFKLLVQEHQIAASDRQNVVIGRWLSKLLQECHGARTTCIHAFDWIVQRCLCFNCIGSLTRATAGRTNSQTALHCFLAVMSGTQPPLDYSKLGPLPSASQPVVHAGAQRLTIVTHPLSTQHTQPSSRGQTVHTPISVHDPETLQESVQNRANPSSPLQPPYPYVHAQAPNGPSASSEVIEAPPSSSRTPVGNDWSASSPVGSYTYGQNIASPGVQGSDHYGVGDNYSYDDSENSLQDQYPWMTAADVKEDDDDFHDPSKTLKGHFEPKRAILNIGSMILLTLALLMLFVGYPVLHHFTEDNDIHDKVNSIISFFSGGPNINGPFPLWRSNNTHHPPGYSAEQMMLIDPDTPIEAYEMESLYSRNSKKKFKLVFSDEFNVDGRSFYPGEDPFWEAVDLHYWQTGNLEWYDPAAVTTRNGALRIQLSEHIEHNSRFRGGMLQSWNKFCFRGGIVLASVQLPGYTNVGGLWPAIWIMGNLGRAGYGATLQGTWPYSYDQCDVGTVQNQTLFNGETALFHTKFDDIEYPVGYPNGTTMIAGAVGFNKDHNTSALSFLPGQKLSRCTCEGEDHPGPFVNGEFTGRAAPEIDMFEAQIQTHKGEKMAGVSQSMQIAPYNWKYMIAQGNNSPVYHFFDEERLPRDQLGTELNWYTGEITQQSMSGTSVASQTAVQYNASSPDPPPPGKVSDGNYANYAVEYGQGSDGYVVWLSDNKKTWELFPEVMRPDNRSMIHRRTFPQEPMYLIMNLGVSNNFGKIDWSNLQGGFPFEMSVDWIRVYQDPDNYQVGCDPKDMPTADYIERHIEAYTNPNLTVWGGTREEGGYGAAWPKNKLYNNGHGCNALPSREPGDPTLSKPPHAPLLPPSWVTAMPGGGQPAKDREDV